MYPATQDPEKQLRPTWFLIALLDVRWDCATQGDRTNVSIHRKLSPREPATLDIDPAALAPRLTVVKDGVLLGGCVPVLILVLGSKRRHLF